MPFANFTRLVIPIRLSFSYQRACLCQKIPYQQDDQPVKNMADREISILDLVSEKHQKKILDQHHFDGLPLPWEDSYDTTMKLIAEHIRKSEVALKLVS